MSVTNPIILDKTGQRIANALESMANRDVLAQLDGTQATYKAVMREWFVTNGANDATPAELTALCDKWYALTRDTWCGWVEFYQPDVSSVSTGTKGGDNEGLVCEPSTDTVAGQDDYAGLPLFACVDVNFIVDPDTLDPMITAIDGITNNFKRYSPDVFVGVMQMSGYIFTKESADTYVRGYSATAAAPATDISPLPDAVKVDGDVREWVVHAKYMSHTFDSHLTSYAGVSVTHFISHNTSHTLSNALGMQYSGSTSADDTFIHIMYMIKYASLTMDGIIQGGCNFSYQYPVLVSEDGVKRAIITTAQAENIEVGMEFIIGDYDSSKSSVLDRGNTNLYSITGQAGAAVTSIETVTIDGAEYAAIYFDDMEDSFNTVANGSAVDGTTYISSWGWPTGKTDGVLGNDGSPVNNTSGKYPGKIQGIELMNGCYEVVSDIILQMAIDDDGDCTYEPFVVKRSANQGTAISSAYESVGLKCPDTVTSAGWQYIKKKAYKNGMFFPIEVGGSSTTYHRDGFYQAVPNAQTREMLLRGGLTVGVGGAGFSALSGNSALSTAAWNFASRLSAGGNRGEWAG